MKKLLALTLALLLVILLLPTTVLAEEGNEYVAKNINKDKEYASLRDALGAATDGDTITLLKNCELSEGNKTIRVEKTGITLDLNGCMMTLKSLLSVQGGATFTIQNNKTAGGIKVECESVITSNNKTVVKLIGVKITEADETKDKKWLFDAQSGSTYYIKGCDITWGGICEFEGDSATIEDTTMKLTGSKDAFIMEESTSRLEIINSTITGDGAKLFITPDTNNRDTTANRPSVSIANNERQSGIIDYFYNVYKGYNSGKFILPGVSDASTKLKAMLKDSFTSDTLLVSVPEGLYISSTALDCLGTAERGKTYTIEQAGPPDQMAKLAEARAVPANGCTIKNGTGAAITVNGEVIRSGESHTFTEKGPELDPELDPPSTIVIIRPAEEETTQPNPATGAPQVIAVAAAASAIAAVLAAVLLLRRKEE